MFSTFELNRIEAKWRELPQDHPWTGLAYNQNQPGSVWIFRQRANWRQFVLEKSEDGYCLKDEFNIQKIDIVSLDRLETEISKIAALQVNE